MEGKGNDRKVVEQPFAAVGKLISSVFFLKPANARNVPQFRGKIHLLLLYLAPVWICCFFLHASSVKAVVASAIACLSSLFNFSASALLHNFPWPSEKARQRVRRIDHAGIFVMIAGCCAPVPLLLMEFWKGCAVLVIQWTASIIGIWTILFADFSGDQRSRRAALYVIIGLLNVLFVREYCRVSTGFEFLCLAGMASSYILGAVVYARKSPNPFPDKVGFHELFHFFCFLAAFWTFFLNISVLKRTPNV